MLGLFTGRPVILGKVDISGDVLPGRESVLRLVHFLKAIPHCHLLSMVRLEDATKDSSSYCRCFSL